MLSTMPTSKKEEVALFTRLNWEVTVANERLLASHCAYLDKTWRAVPLRVHVTNSSPLARNPTLCA